MSKEENKFFYNHKISGLLLELGIPSYNSNNWRLFLDSSKHSLKCVWLHNGNIYAAVPEGHSVCLQEEHNDNKTVIDLLKYHEENWTICVDLKLVNFFLGQQSNHALFAYGTAEQETSIGIWKSSFYV